MLYSTCLLDGDGRRLSLQLIQSVWAEQTPTDLTARAMATWSVLQRTRNARACEDHYLIHVPSDVYDVIALHAHDLLPVTGRTD